jgi:hypothetical protein
MKDHKINTSYRLSTDAVQLLALMAQRWGLSRTAMLEVLIRQQAIREERAYTVSDPHQHREERRRR